MGSDGFWFSDKKRKEEEEAEEGPAVVVVVPHVFFFFLPGKTKTKLQNKYTNYLFLFCFVLFLFFCLAQINSLISKLFFPGLVHVWILLLVNGPDVRFWTVWQTVHVWFSCLNFGTRPDKWILIGSDLHWFGLESGRFGF